MNFAFTEERRSGSPNSLSLTVGSAPSEITGWALTICGLFTTFSSAVAPGEITVTFDAAGVGPFTGDATALDCV